MKVNVIAKKQRGPYPNIGHIINWKVYANRLGYGGLSVTAEVLKKEEELLR